MTTVLIINHTQEKCGVFQYGHNTALTLQNSIKYKFIEVNCEDAKHFFWYVNQYNPVVIIYNYHVSTLGWLNDSIFTRYPTIKHLVIQHEPHQPAPKGASGIISQNPADPEDATHFSVPRILHPYTKEIPHYPTLTVGTFGFGLGGKGYDRLVDRVCEEFEAPLIRMHIPFAHYGDSKGDHAKSWVALARKRITNPRACVHADHEWYTTEQLLDFLACNDLNIFMYDDMARGTASVLDFALSVPRPIAITRSTMFRHVWEQVPEVLVEQNTLQDILLRGTKPLEPLYEQWAPEKLVEKYERIVATVL